MADGPALLVLDDEQHVARLAAELAANRAAAGRPAADLACVTLRADGALGRGRAELAATREVLVLATGRAVAPALAELAATGGGLPAFHRNLLVVGDRAAAARLAPAPGRASDHVVVVLGHREPGTGPEHRISSHSRARLFRAEEVCLEEPVRAAILTGYTHSGGLSEAEQLGREWTLADVPPVLEVAGRSTAENAARSLPLILALGGIRRVTVVTSPWHLRAPYLFAPYRRFGLEVRMRPSRALHGWGRLLAAELRGLRTVRTQRSAAMAGLGPWTAGNPSASAGPPRMAAAPGRRTMRP